MRLIDADVLKAIYDPSSYEGHDPNENWDNVISTFEEIRADIDDQPTVDAVPVSWINKHLEWLNNCDNDFAQLAKASILGMLELWRKDGVLNEQAN